MMKPVYQVATNTFKELIRDRILYALLFFALVLVVLSYFMGLLSFAEQERIIANMGLFAINLGCTFLAIFLGSSLVFREIDKQTILTLLSKPLSRSQFVLGKFLGLSAILLLMNVVLSIILILICYSFTFFSFYHFFISQVGTFMEAEIVLAVAIFFGSFARPLLTTFFAFSIWLVAHGMSDLNYFSQKSRVPLARVLGQLFSKYFLNFERFNFREAAIYQDVIPAETLFSSFFMFCCWLFVLIFFTQRIFAKRDFI